LKIKRYIVYCLGLAILLGSCAKPGAPTGGPIDFDPPVVVKSVPAFGSSNFKGKSIEIFFDEYVQLKDINQQLVISPPLPKKPRVISKGKSILIELNNQLADSTTYTLNFGNSISDNNENNPLNNYRFMFSTGPYVDSLSVSGQVVNAFTMKPEKDPVTVMLYSNLNDTAPTKTLPMYIGKTDTKGVYSIHNMKKGTYRLYAVADVNSNLKYDKGSELFAFADTSIVLDPSFLKKVAEPEPAVDSVRIKKLMQIKRAEIERKKKMGVEVKDTSVVDTVKHPQVMLWGVLADMKLFKEDPDEVYLKDRKRNEDFKFHLVFNRAPYQKPEIRLLTKPAIKDWYLPDFSATNDSMVFWLKDSSLIKRDTIPLELKYKSIKKGKETVVCDTLNLRFLHKEIKHKKDEKIKIPVIKPVFTPSDNAPVEQYENLEIEAEAPISKVETDSVFLYMQKDSLSVPVKFSFKNDTVNPRKVFLLFDKEEDGGQYILDMMPGALTTIYGRMNDTIEHKFNVRSNNYYGNLIVNTGKYKYPLIAQIWEKEKFIVEQKVDPVSGKAEFKQLLPSTYIIKLIVDKNGNGKWDTGDFTAKKQPEVILFNNSSTQVRTNWDIEVNITPPTEP
jgi:uncharacterized protein (DUF2141 family)